MTSVSDFLLQQSVQVSIVFGLALLGSWLLRNASAHWRYLLWLLVIAKCLVPALFSLQLAIWPATSNSVDIAADTLRNNAQPGFEFERDPLKRSAVEHSAAVAPDSVGSESGETPIESSTSIARQSTEAGLAISDSNQQATSVPTMFPFQIWIAFVWLLPVTLLSIYVALKVYRTDRKLRFERRPADSKTRQQVAEFADQLGMRRLPRVFEAASVTQPFVWGCLRGDVYLPNRFAETCTVEQQQAILTHELSHVVRWDAAVNLLQILTQIVFFFHPLVWWANKRIRQEREKCCDEIVLAGLAAKPQQYCEAIVEMLAREVQAKKATPGLTSASSTRNIEDRITTILTPDRKFHRHPNGLALVVLVLVAVLTLSTSLALTNRSVAQEADEKSEAKLAQEEANAGQWQAGRTLDFQAIHAVTKEPIAGVKLALQNAGDGIDFGDVARFETDQDGRAKIKLSDLPANQVRVYTGMDGFVPLRIYWANLPNAIMPDSITIPLHPAKEIGGKIIDEAGEPIPGVTVRVQYWAPGKGEAKGQDPHIRANVVATTKTDMSGNWKLDSFPEEIPEGDWQNQLWVWVNHPDFVSDRERRGFFDRSVVERPAIEKLVDQSSTITMRRGEEINGRIVDQDGHPIANASIHTSDYYWLLKEGPRAISDKDGNFKVTGINPPGGMEIGMPVGFDGASNMKLTIEADGYATELVKVNDLDSSVRVEMKPGRAAAIQVVDSEGMPIEGASIYARKWRDLGDRIHIVEKSDAMGMIHLKDLPADEVQCDFGKQGFMSVDRFAIKPSDEEYLITLMDPVKVVGTVVDDETGEPLQEFTMMPGTDHEDGRLPQWMNSFAKKIINGRYETEFRQEIAYRVRIEAKGYMPAESRIFRPHDPDAGVLTWDVRLQKADPITGLVLGLDGKPLANAKVYRATHLIQVSGGKISYVDPRMTNTKTDEEGRFELPPEVEPYCLIVDHADGIAMLTNDDHSADAAITIKEWSTIPDGLFNINIRPSRNGQPINFPKQADQEE